MHVRRRRVYGWNDWDAGSVQIVARDLFGNQVSEGGQRWAVHIFTTKDVSLGSDVASIHPSPVDNDDGTYTVTYQSPENGKHRIMTYHVQDGNEKEIRDFINDNVVFMNDDGYSVPGQSIAFGPGIKGGRVGETLHFTTQIRNELGLNRPEGGVSLETKLTFLLDESLKVDVVTADRNDGTFSSSYTTLKAGTYLLDIKMASDSIQGSPFEITILPSETHPDSSSIMTTKALVSIVAETVTFKIQSRDKNYNDQVYDEFAGPDAYVARFEMVNGDGMFYGSIQNGMDGTYECSYGTTRAGAYKMFVTLNGVGSYALTKDSITVSPGETVTENVVVSGSGINNMEAGQFGFVKVTSLDLYGNVVQTGSDQYVVDLMKEGGEARPLGVAQHCDTFCLEKTSCPCSELGPGTYAVLYQVTVASSYQITVELNRNLLNGFPRDVVVSPSLVDTTQVSVVGCESYCQACPTESAPCAPCQCPVFSRMKAGTSLTFSLESRDRFGNMVTSGGKAFRAVMGKAVPPGKTGCYVSDGCTPAVVQGELFDNKDGTYLTTITGSVPGDYVLNVTRSRVSILGSPFAVKIIPGAASSGPEGSSYALDPIATAGSAKTFTIQSRDVFGNRLSLGGEQYVTQLKGTSAAFRNMVIKGAVEDNSDGSYFAYFMTERAGLYDVGVKLDGVQILPGVTAITVFPAAVEASTSSVSGTGLDALQSAGDAAVDSKYIAPEIRIIPRDMYGNVYSFDGLHIEAKSTGDTLVVSRSTQDKRFSKYVECGAGCGEYIIYNPLTVSGNYNLDVLLHIGGVGRSLLAGGPAVFKLDASMAHSPMCTYDQGEASQATRCDTDTLCTFQVQAVDYFGNKVEQRGDRFVAKLTYVSTRPVATVYDGSSTDARDSGGGILAGLYDISYRVTVSGQYNLQISRYGLPIKNSPSILEIDPGIPSASACTTHPVQASDGLGMIGGKQNTPQSFTVYARDQFGNIAKQPSIQAELKVTVKAPDGSDASAVKSPLAGGRYKVQYIPNQAGDYTISVQVGDIHVVGSPYSATIVDQYAETSNMADNRFSTIQDDQEMKYLISTVNAVKTFPMKMRNNVGIDLDTAGGARFEVRFQGVYCGECAQNPVTPDGSSQYSCCIDHREDPPTITYFAMKAGLANLDVKMVKLNELTNPPILNSPFEVQIVPDDTDGKSSVVDSLLPGESIACVAGLAKTHTLVARDKYGNKQIFKPEAIAGVSIELEGPSTVTTMLQDWADGSFGLFYTITRAGYYSMSVKLAGSHVQGSPFNVSVAPDILFVRASTSQFSTWKKVESGVFAGKYIGTAGVTNVALVQSRDAFGNVLGGMNDAFSMSMQKDITSTMTLKPQGSGNYEAVWGLKKSGTYYGAIFGVMGGCTSSTTCANVMGSPFQVEILPDRIVAENCRVYGTGSTYSVANDNGVVYIIARDKFDNDVISQDSVQYFDMTLTSVVVKRSGFYEWDNKAWAAKDDSFPGANKISLSGQSQGITAGGIKMIYKAVMNGEYLIDVTYNQTRIGGTSGSWCGTNRPCPKVDKAASPVALFAKFSDSGGHIYIDFDQPTNKANVTGTFPCSRLLKEDSAKLLAADPNDATCRFLSASRLDIVLGFGATILVNQDLDWQKGVLSRRPVCETRDVCFNYSFAIEGRVRVKRPDNAVSPTAILKAAASVGPCDSVILDASASYGSAGRQLQYFFGLMPGSKNDKDVRSFILAKVVKPYTTNMLEIPKHLLMVGETYQFIVKVSNFLDASHNDMVTVRKVAESGPAIFIEGPNTLNVQSSVAFKLRGSAKLSACNEGAEDIDWLWTVTSNLEPASKLLTLNEQTKDTRNLYVSDGVLVPGATYFFTLTGQMRGNESNVGSATVQVNCIFGPVVARIAGGNQAVSISSDLKLDATGSLDLDGVNAVGTFSYKWSCTNAAGGACFDDVDGMLMRDSGVLELDQGTLVPGVYTFGVTVSKEPGPRTASTSVIVYIMPTPQMPVSVLPLAKAKINSNERLVLESSLESGCGGTQAPDLTWSQSAGDDVLQYPSMISTPTNLKGLAFKPNVFVPGAIYRFRLTARCPMSSVGPITASMGFGEVEVKINVAPSSGQFQVAPTVGMGTEDTFTLKLVNWVDDPEDLPFKYEFRYATDIAPEDQVPLGTVDINSLEARLPGPTTSAVSHAVTLIAFVVDQYAASTKSEKVVTVMNSNSTSSSRRLLQFSASLLDQHVATGNVEGIIQMTISLSNDKGLTCTAKEGMIEKLKAAAAKVVMNKAEVAGFSYAVKSAMAGDCVSSGSRRLLADSATDNALELTGSLVGNSMAAGLDPTAERGMADTLSSSLGSISTKNKARRSLRRLLSMDMYMQEGGKTETPPFFRGQEGRDFVMPRKISEGQYHVLSAGDSSGGPSQKSGDMLMGARDSLMGSQLNGALTGEDAKGVSTEKIAMSATQKTPADLAGAKMGTGGSSFATPASMFPAGTGSDLQAKSSNLADSPFDSDNDVGNVAGLSMGVSVNNLTDPIELEMPSKASARRAGKAPPLQYKCVSEAGVVSALTYWTMVDCVAGCTNKSSGKCIEMSNDACQKDEWDSCVDGEVDTCRFWNSKLNDWDGEGCIVQGSKASGGVMCHCYHLTDFGGAGSDVMPKMNVPDPTNPGAAFKNLSADKILVIALLCLFLLMYWGLFYWGWRQDRIDNERMDAAEEKEISKAQERKMRAAEQEETLVAGNNFRLLQKSMNGKLSKSMMMIRNKAFKLLQGQHKLFSAFYVKRHHYTRPRRFTVLFVMLIGNMMVNGFFCGDEAASMIQKIISGLIAGMIMVPATMFFKYIFMTLDVDPRTRARWERDTSAKTKRMKQEMAITMTTGPTADGMSAPPPHLRGVVPPRKIARGYVPYPDQARIGVSSRNGVFANPFKRRWTTAPAAKAQALQEEGDGGAASSRPFTPVSIGDVGRAPSDRSMDSGRNSNSSDDGKYQDAGAYLPRRALPMRSDPRPPAPSVLSSRDELSSVMSVPLHLTREMEDGPAERREMIQDHTEMSKKTKQRLTGKAKFEAAVAKKLVAAVSKPVDERKDKRKKLIDYRFQYMAYLLATIFYGVCFYFCLLLGVTFSKEIENAWLMAFFLAIFQDLFITETLVISMVTSVKMVLVPNIAALISGRIAKKYS